MTYAATRDAVHGVVDTIPESRLVVAGAVLEAIAAGVSGEDLEDTLDAYELQRLRDESAGEELLPLEEVGRRLGLK